MMNDLSELRAVRAVTVAAMRVMLDGADEDQEYLTPEQEAHFIMGCAKVNQLDTQIRAAKASSAYWSERMGEAADLDEPAWEPRPLLAGQQLGIVDPAIPSAKGQARLQEWRRRLYAMGGAL